jgi:ABC-2 type transport system ATP-binding protein
LQEVEAICSRVLILNEGRIAAQGTPEEIGGTLKGGDTWELTLKGSGIGEKCARLGLTQQSAGAPGSGAFTLKENGALSELSFFLPASPDKGSIDGERIFDWAVAEGIKILGMKRRSLSLEDIFVKLTNDEVVSKPLTSEGDSDEK